jgi:hypothetical protein
MLTIREMKDLLANVEIAEDRAHTTVKAYGFDPGNQKVWFYAKGEIDNLEHFSEVTRFQVEAQGLCLTYAEDDTEAHETLRAVYEACVLENTVLELRDRIGEMPDGSEDEDGEDDDA